MQPTDQSGFWEAPEQQNLSSSPVITSQGRIYFCCGPNVQALQPPVLDEGGLTNLQGKEQLDALVLEAIKKRPEFRGIAERLLAQADAHDGVAARLQRGRHDQEAERGELVHDAYACAPNTRAKIVSTCLKW